MQLRWKPPLASVILAASLTVGLGGVPVMAQSGASDWGVLTEGPALGDLTAGALAADASGTAVLVGFSGSGSQPRGNKPLEATARAWSSPDGATWTEVVLPGAAGAVSRAVSAGPSGFVAVGKGKGGGRIWHSPTGDAWTEVSGGSAPDGDIFDVAGGPAGYVAVGLTTEGKGKKLTTVPTAWTSADGMAWTSAPMADLAGAGVSVAASPAGGLLAAVYQPERRGPKTSGTFDVLPPGLTFFHTTDGKTWVSTAASPAEDVSTLGSWDLTHAAGQYRFSAVHSRGASEGIRGHFASPDGSAWTSVPQLLGLNGATGPLGDGVIALGDAAVVHSEDGSSWHSSVEEALTGARTRSVVSLADGRVIAAGPAPTDSAGGYVLYAGTVPSAGVTPASDCVDAVVLEEVLSLREGVFALSAPDRERIAAALAAYVPTDATAYAPGQLVTALREGGSLDASYFLGLLSGQVVIPACA